MSGSINVASTLALAGVCFVGGFSRFTSGLYLSRFYAYQLSRAPNDTWIIPAVDIALGVLLLPRRTRRYAAAALNIFMTLGIWRTLKAWI
ncbi:hypothetical protein C8F01DRAFT_1134982 [Mycena amicta]|nr:hypothetical protein C8F01DRAFT_1134982 [Mycena amicta]